MQIKRIKRKRDKRFVFPLSTGNLIVRAPDRDVAVHLANRRGFTVR